MSINFFRRGHSRGVTRVDKNVFTEIKSVTGGNTANGLAPGNGFKYHTFTSTGGNQTLTVTSGIEYNPTRNRVIKTEQTTNTAEVLVIGSGGGGSGHAASGGGGAGGVAWAPNLVLNSGSYTVYVAPGSPRGPNQATSYSGTTSTFTGGPQSYNIQGLAGGYGGRYSPGGSGGSGGGGAGWNPSSNNSNNGGVGTQSWQSQPSRVKNFGGSGGTRYSPGSYHAGSGGGGAGTSGRNAPSNTSGGRGGDGIQLPQFFGPLIGLPGLAPLNSYFAGGGGSGAWSGETGAPGGLGGAGGGGGYVSVGGDGASHTGSGGGGGNGPNYYGGGGGSGIVVVRYQVPQTNEATSTTIYPTVAVRNGLSASQPGTSARQILTEYPGSPTGFYYIQAATGVIVVYCDMTNDDGGWMMIHQCNGTGTTGASQTQTQSAVGSITGFTPGTTTGSISATYKLADADTNYFMKNAVIGIDRLENHRLPCFRVHTWSVGPSGGFVDYYTVSTSQPYGYNAYNYQFANGNIDFRGLTNAPAGADYGGSSVAGWDNYGQFLSSPNSPTYNNAYSSATYAGWGQVVFYNHDRWGQGTIYNAQASNTGFHANGQGVWSSTGGLWYR